MVGFQRFLDYFPQKIAEMIQTSGMLFQYSLNDINYIMSQTLPVWIIYLH